jgi:hypothetical protein
MWERAPVAPPENAVVAWARRNGVLEDNRNLFS